MKNILTILLVVFVTTLFSQKYYSEKAYLYETAGDRHTLLLESKSDYSVEFKNKQIIIKGEKVKVLNIIEAELSDDTLWIKTKEGYDASLDNNYFGIYFIDDGVYYSIFYEL